MDQAHFFFGGSFCDNVPLQFCFFLFAQRDISWSRLVSISLSLALTHSVSQSPLIYCSMVNSNLNLLLCANLLLLFKFSIEIIKSIVYDC